MSTTDVVAAADPPVITVEPAATASSAEAVADRRADLEGVAAAVVELAADELTRRGEWGPDDDQRILAAIVRAAARLAWRRRRHLGAGDADEPPVPAAGWWSFAAELPEVDEVDV